MEDNLDHTFQEKKQLKYYDSVAEYYADKYGIGSDDDGKCERTERKEKELS